MKNNSCLSTLTMDAVISLIMSSFYIANLTITLLQEALNNGKKAPAIARVKVFVDGGQYLLSNSASILMV